jgi:hypothetical protein
MKDRKKEKVKKLSFEEVVKATSDISDCFQKGLKAFGKNSTKIKLNDNKQCEGSVDIDTCVTAKYPNDSRWDYMFSYMGSVYFVEIHSADTSEVSVVLKKLKWLKDWLKTQAPEIEKLRAKENAFFWIQSKRYNILPNSKQARQLAQEGLKPISELKL